jgi:hypothetical protein
MRLLGDRPIAVLGALMLSVVCVAAALLLVARSVVGSGDYAIHGLVAGDNAGPAINALVHGQLANVVRLQPLMGLTSIIWRAPFAGFGGLLGGSDQLIYECGSAACLLPAAGLVAWLVSRTGSIKELVGVTLAAVTITLGPATLQAVQVGHPEEVLATVLATGAVISAAADRRGAAAALLGLAIGTKQWALLAVPCVLLAVPDARRALAAKTAFVAVPAVTLLPLINPGAFARADTSVGALNIIYPFSIWWPAGRALRGAPASASAHLLPLGLHRSGAAAIVLALGLAAIWAYARRDRATGSSVVDGLPLLALVGLLRCIADPDPLAYNFVAAVIPLAVWEAGVIKRPPVVTVLSCAALGLFSGANPVLRWNGPLAPTPIHDVLWIGSCLALACYLTRCASGARLLSHTPRPAPPVLRAVTENP